MGEDEKGGEQTRENERTGEGHICLMDNEGWLWLEIERRYG